MSNPIVEIKYGKLKGQIRKTNNDVSFNSFKGIPYAKPPLEELRFAVPQPPEPWAGTRDATQNCNISAQFDMKTNSIVGDEDCLYLNVYSPNLKPTKALPVMVFIHGGGFVSGNGTDDSLHGPDYLIEHDVVVVTLNYRLGILGFLNLDTKDAQGNMGLKDQVQALKWVQQNISQFGGDPANVTIFGISAGGASVEYLTLSPTAKGLFHKAIAQSGTSLLPWAQYDRVKELAAKIPVIKGKAITDSDRLLEYLKELPTKDLVATSMLALAADARRRALHFGFVPSIEKPSGWEPFLDKSSYDLLLQGKFNKVPYLTGICDSEGLITVTELQSKIEKLAKEKNFVDYLPFDIDESEKTELNNKLKAVYLDIGNKSGEDDAYLVDFLGDLDFIGGAYVAATILAKHNSPVYFYDFAYDGRLNYLKKKLSITRKGACHADDGGYIVYCELLPKNITATDKLVLDRMVTMWTNFAKCGNPTPEVNDTITTKWEPIAETGLSYLLIDEDMTMKENLYPARMKIFQEIYDKYYPK